MAHFAQLDDQNNVINVIVVENSNILDENGQESESIGIQYCKNILGGNWAQTSYNANFRYNYAEIGGTYDSNRDAFISVKPFDSWVLNEDNYQWVAPIPYPNDDNEYSWDEETISWIKILEG